ncbi:MAG: hypothetical protein P4L45_15940 [Ignavibacteriaceae bacterium]|nr:hypothetical protein [Ignavibacteriaceae bacterium]
MNKEIEKEKVNAVCPHCLKKIDLVWVCRINSIIGTRNVFFCGECQKSLGISHEKEFTDNIMNVSIINTAKIASNSL